ncbi:MAG: amidohydrolase family protein [Pseudonocardiaceae bacterium]|nr:amidohydrolase family protein [Pseudonocardiaceae bacterium]
MVAIDIHTHMLSEAWVSLLANESGHYHLGYVPSGDRAVFKADTAFMTLTDGMFDYDARIAAMDEAGVDLSIVSLTCPNVFWGSADVSNKAAQLMNDDMRAAQDKHPDRLRFFASIPWQHPALAIRELDRACELGAVGVMVLANIDGVSLTDPVFADVWAAIDERELPVLLHPSSPIGVENLDMTRFHLVWSVGFTFDTTLALARMIMDGFFDRYRNLKVIGGHAGGYLPFLIGRLDAGFRSFESCRERIDALPSSYLKQVYVDSIVYAPEALRLTVETMGHENVLFGTDYPHKNGDMAEIRELVSQLPDEQRAAVMGGNAQRLFAL